MTAVSASTAQATIAAANSSRNVLLLINLSRASLYISTQNGFSKANAPFVVGPSQQWTLPAPYTGALYGVWDMATGNAIVQEG